MILKHKDRFFAFVLWQGDPELVIDRTGEKWRRHFATRDEALEALRQRLAEDAGKVDRQVKLVAAAFDGADFNGDSELADEVMPTAFSKLGELSGELRQNIAVLCDDHEDGEEPTPWMLGEADHALERDPLPTPPNDPSTDWGAIGILQFALLIPGGAIPGEDVPAALRTLRKRDPKLAREVTAALRTDPHRSPLRDRLRQLRERLSEEYSVAVNEEVKTAKAKRNGKKGRAA